MFVSRSLGVNAKADARCQGIGGSGAGPIHESDGWTFCCFFPADWRGLARIGADPEMAATRTGREKAQKAQKIFP
jgi:hypothetical protein